MKYATVFALLLVSATAFQAPQFATRAVGKKAPATKAVKKFSFGKKAAAAPAVRRYRKIVVNSEDTGLCLGILYQA